MAIPLTGPISIGDFNTILGRASNTADSRLAGASTPATGTLVWLAGQSGGGLSQTAPFSFSDWRGYEPTNPPTTTTTTTVAALISFIGSSQSTGTSITLPGGLQQDDIVIICSMSDGSSQNLPSTYINGQNGSSNSVNYRWSYKRMGATPDSTATGLSSSSVHIAIVFRNVATAVTFDATTPAIATNTSGMPNPPAITTVTNNAMVVAIGFLDDDVVASSVTAPTGFTLARAAQYGSSGSGGTVMAAYRLKSPAGSENAGAFGGSGTDSWVAAKLALRPA